MKTLLCLLSLLIFAGYDVLGADAKGLLIYTDHPSTYVECCEFYSLDSTKPSYYTIVRADGRRLQINPGGLWIVVDYPQLTPGEDIMAVADSDIATIQSLETTYPQFKPQLKAAQTKWQNALAFARQVAANTAKAQAQIPKITLTVDGTTYNDVCLTSLDIDSAGISHSAGVAKVPLAKLTKEQIAALNTTSPSVHIDPDWAEKKAVADKIAAEDHSKKQASADATPPVNAGTTTANPSPTIALQVKTSEDIRNEFIESVKEYGLRYSINVQKKLKPADFGYPASYADRLYQVVVTGIDGEYVKWDIEKKRRVGSLSIQQVLRVLYAPTNGGSNPIDDRHFASASMFHTDSVLDFVDIPHASEGLALLITTETAFESGGNASILATAGDAVTVELKDGFSKSIPVLIEKENDDEFENKLVDTYKPIEQKFIHDTPPGSENSRSSAQATPAFSPSSQPTPTFQNPLDQGPHR